MQNHNIRTETTVHVFGREYSVEFTLDDWIEGPFTIRDIDFIFDVETGEIMNAVPLINPTTLECLSSSNIRTLVWNELKRSQPEFIYHNQV